MLVLLTGEESHDLHVYHIAGHFRKCKFSYKWLKYLQKKYSYMCILISVCTCALPRPLPLHVCNVSFSVFSFGNAQWREGTTCTMLTSGPLLLAPPSWRHHRYYNSLSSQANGCRRVHWSLEGRFKAEIQLQTPSLACRIHVFNCPFIILYLEASYEIYENMHHTKISRYT